MGNKFTDDEILDFDVDFDEPAVNDSKKQLNQKNYSIKELEQAKNVKVSEPDIKEQLNNKEETKRMDTIVKVLIAIGGVGLASAAIFAFSTYNNDKTTEVQKAATAVQIEVQDTNATTYNDRINVEQKARPDYNAEAEKAFENSGIPDEYKDKFILYYTTFREKGIEPNRIVDKFNEKYVVTPTVLEETNDTIGAEVAEAETEEKSEAETEEKPEAVDTKVATKTEIEMSVLDENESFELLLLDTGDTVKYVQTNCNLRSGPGTNFDKIGSLKTNQEVIAHALAPTGELWCQLVDEKGNEVGYVYYDYLGDSKVQTQQKAQSQSSQSQPAQSQPAQPATEQKPTPQPTVQEEPVQQPVQPAPMPGGTLGDVPMGTPGDGSGANGMFGNCE